MTKRYLVGKHDRVFRTDTYLVRVECFDGKVLEDLEPRRLFPYTFPNRYITLLNTKEREEAIINSLDDLDEDSRKAVELCFADYYMVPEILEILHIEDKRSFKWLVRTEKGRVEFHIRNRHSDIKEHGGIIVIRDANDNRYRADLSRLDEKSLKKISCYI
jgi:hypothetical protein